MKYLYPLAVCCLVCMLLYPSDQSWGFRHLKEGEATPDFTLKDLGGETHSLSQSKGKVVIVLYWRLGQERSLEALRALKPIMESFHKQPLCIFAITKEGDLSALKKIKESLGLPFPILLDANEEVYSRFGVFVFPSTALIDRNGVYRLHYGGYRDDYEERITVQIKLLLGLISRKDLDSESGEQSTPLSEAKKRAQNHINLGRTLSKRGMEEKAIEEFEKAVALDESNPEGHILLGFELFRQDKTDLALQHFTTAITLNPGSSEAKTGLGMAYRLTGQTEKALVILRDALKLNPDSALIHLELGRVYEATGDEEEALKQYKTAALRALEKEAW